MSALSDDSVATPQVESMTLAKKPVASDRQSAADNQTYVTKTYRWNRPNYSKFNRRLHIWRFVFVFLVSLWWNNKNWTYLGGATEAKKARRRRRQAIWIRESLLDLGPTFIKLGQLFSTRSDLFPSDYVEELSKLQDRVPAFDFEQVETIVQQDFGKSISQLYRYFNPTPMAAASLGQVHKAQLQSGEEVVVKIQRPGLRQLFSIDLSIAKTIVHYFQNHPKWGKGRDWLGIYDECYRILYEEIDYINEGRNADTFRRNFRDQDWVQVPRVYWGYTSIRTLTLEYIPGIKISNYEALEAAGLDRRRLAVLGADAYLRQLLNHGFFHADPHPGNIAVNPQGSLIFYDFGMMGRIRPDIRQQMMELFFGIAEKNGDRVVEALIELGALTPTGDMGPVRRSIQYILDRMMEQTFEEQSVSAISDDLYEIAYDQPFRFPATFTFVMRAFSTLEGVGKGLDPDFNFMEVAKPFAMQIMNDGTSGDHSSIFNELGRQAAQVSSTALGLPRRIDDTIEKLERGDLRLRVRSIETDRALRRVGDMQMVTSYSTLAGALTISATVLLVAGQGWVMWLALPVVGGAGAMGINAIRVLKRIEKFDRMF